MSFSACIYRRNDKLAIAFCDSAGHSSDRTGYDWPATQEGLADLKLALKNDELAAAADFDGIDMLTLPEEGQEIDECELTGDGDPG